MRICETTLSRVTATTRGFHLSALLHTATIRGGEFEVLFLSSSAEEREIPGSLFPSFLLLVHNTSIHTHTHACVHTVIHRYDGVPFCGLYFDLLKGHTTNLV